MRLQGRQRSDIQCLRLTVLGQKLPRIGDSVRMFWVHSAHKQTVRSKSHIRGFNRRASAISLDADSAYRNLQVRIASESTENAGNREFLRAKEAANWLGIPLRSLHQYVQQGLLPSYKLGRHRLFRKKELLSALGADRTANRSEILR
jgi:excisionase family DNA binding protein